MRISDEYRQINGQLHITSRQYGAWGYRWAETVRDAFGKNVDLLDYGAGKGSLGRTLGFPIFEYDPCIPTKAKEPEPHDYLVCADVLEHVEPECIEEVLEHIASLIKVAGLLVVATRPAHKILDDGRNAHLIIQPVEWWTKKISQYMHIDKVDDSPPLIPGSSGKKHKRFRSVGEYVVWVS